jgi:hypothetical protein
MSHDMTVTIWRSLFRPAEGQRVGFAAVARRVGEPRAYATKSAVPRWSGALFRDDARSLANVEQVAVLAYDFDNGDASRELIEQTFGDLTGVAHTSWSSTPEVKRWRVALLLDRPVTVEEHGRVWRAGAAIAERAGLAPDLAARDASRCWALPALRAGYEHIAFRGALFDVAAALAEFPPPPPESAPRPTDDRPESYSHRLTRARRYLERMPGAISGSHGHATTFRAALVLVRGFALEEDDALALLVEVHNPTCQPPWSARELRHKVRQALQRGRAEHGWLASRPRSAEGARWT